MGAADCGRSRNEPPDPRSGGRAHRRRRRVSTSIEGKADRVPNSSTSPW